MWILTTNKTFRSYKRGQAQTVALPVNLYLPLLTCTWDRPSPQPVGRLRSWSWPPPHLLEAPGAYRAETTGSTRTYKNKKSTIYDWQAAKDLIRYVSQYKIIRWQYITLPLHCNTRFLKFLLVARKCILQDWILDFLDYLPAKLKNLTCSSSLSNSSLLFLWRKTALDSSLSFCSNSSSSAGSCRATSSSSPELHSLLHFIVEHHQ